ncbi:hypothetical protein VTP01DRAFT_2832 [Rhizomucor pusillus]|uniref:uncharacterized protein n=1 Tax=Rhizomucor pusillus TaxID=4840 RepID=UPI00374489A9
METQVQQDQQPIRRRRPLLETFESELMYNTTYEIVSPQPISFGNSSRYVLREFRVDVGYQSDKESGDKLQVAFVPCSGTSDLVLSPLSLF